MKKQFVAVAVLLMTSSTASLAQSRNMISTKNSPPRTFTSQDTQFLKIGWEGGLGTLIAVGPPSHITRLVLHKNALAAVTLSSGFIGGSDEFQPPTDQEIWSVALPGEAKSALVQKDGVFEVLDAKGNILWRFGCGGGRDMRFHSDGSLVSPCSADAEQVFSK